ncbi:MAG: class I SAM-dependent methyltransferase [Burkholderiaceae bacterium]|nr:class I SAM-dependent methyltransferase [Burkholderiaceae bacterium]
MTHSEPDEVRARYLRRVDSIEPDRYSLLKPDVWHSVFERQRAMLKLFAAHGFNSFTQTRLLEVGCGAGGNLLELLRMGFAPENLSGVELLPERFALARRALPTAVTLHEGNAVQLQVAGRSLDIVLASTVFSSLLDDAFQQQLADTMWRWLKPGGTVLWYDFTVDNPRNPDVRGVPLARVRALFPAGHITHRRLTLAPPIARAVTRLHPALYTVFNALPVLRTHILCWIRKP